jgi:hypothetical protein
MNATTLSLKILTLGGLLASYNDDDEDLVDDDVEDLDGFSIEEDEDEDADIGKDDKDDDLEGEDGIGGD